MLKITESSEKTIFAPLDRITIQGASGGTVTIRDGQGREYVRTTAGKGTRARIGGALGTHVVFHEDERGVVRQSVSFRVDTKTAVDDAGGLYKELFDALHWTMVGWKENFAESKTVRINGKIYNYFIHWLRDHVHTMKGMKYFAPELKSAIDLYADHQRADGLVFDLVSPREKEPNWTDWANGKYGFMRTEDDRTVEFRRIPIENDVEYLFIEGLYYTWKATGDNAWMASRLDGALKALKYSTTDPLRWSSTYGLLKRGFTIDTWDFQSEEDIKITGQNMTIDPKRTRFGVMFGDNTGWVAGCSYLAEMLEHAGRRTEAARVRKTGQGIKTRLDKIAWNGAFYTHHVCEDPKVKRDLGVDQATQVSLSNAYSLNRGLTHRQCVAIIKTYQRIRAKMPKASPGEFFTIYPPFERGFGGDAGKWQYMNAGVTPIVAGELAHGAFEHGFEEYGADILKRTLDLARRHRNYLHCTYRGMMPTTPKRSFTTISLKGLANTDTHGKGAKGVAGWTGEGDNDLHELPVGRQRFLDIPFEIADPAKNRRRVVVGISAVPGYAESASLLVNKKAASIYFLHTVSRGGALVGTVTITYGDGSATTDYITQGKIGTWWMPSDQPHAKVAWRGKNNTCPNVGMHLYGLNNPHPEKPIASIRFEASRTHAQWFIAALTLCDAKVFFMPSDVSHGIPDPWGAAAVMYGLMEGMVGIKDTGVAFDRALLAPRWSAASIKRASATAKYEASGGYLSYQYALDSAKRKLTIAFTGSAAETMVEVLLPKGKACAAMVLDGEDVAPAMRKVGSSLYACALAKSVGAHELVVALTA